MTCIRNRAGEAPAARVQNPPARRILRCADFSSPPRQAGEQRFQHGRFLAVIGGMEFPARRAKAGVGQTRTVESRRDDRSQVRTAQPLTLKAV